MGDVLSYPKGRQQAACNDDDNGRPMRSIVALVIWIGVSLSGWAVLGGLAIALL